jgi:hypothetical protein
MMDEYTHLLWSFFITQKNLVSETLLPILTLIEKDHNLKINFIISVNAPEHIELQKDIKEHPTLSAKFDFTAPNSPQQNGRIERKFVHLMVNVEQCLMQQSSIKK